MKNLRTICLALLLCSGCVSSEKQFDQKLWKSEDSLKPSNYSDLTDRQRMVNDLVTNHLKGKTKSEIESLLGKSLDVGYFFNNGRDFIYHLGPERSYFAIDSEWLLIWLDEDQVFLRHDFATD